MIYLRIGLSEVEGDAFLGALEVDRMEDRPVVKMEGDMEVVDAEFECRCHEYSFLPQKYHTYVRKFVT